MGLVYICGDFNSRCGDNDDFIAGVDNICERNIVDFKTNYYGNVLLEFLINSNLCLLNGRNFTHNDFTSISAKGSSVVDYCIVSQDDLSLFSEFMVVRVIDLISDIGSVSSVAPAAIPDHSVLLCNIQTNNLIQASIECELKPEKIMYDKFKLSDVSNNFLVSDEVLTKVNDTISRLEASFRAQGDIDEAYSSWCNIVQDEMYGKLPFKTINKSCKGNKKRRVAKPWCSDRLTELWNNFCNAEKLWLHFTDKARKSQLKVQYSDTRKLFDREVQRSKRLYWYKMQCDLDENATSDHVEFWKSIGKIGIGQKRKKFIPMEVVGEVGVIDREIQNVLNKWKQDFSSLLNSEDDNAPSFGNDINNKISDPFLDSHISIIERRYARLFLMQKRERHAVWIKSRMKCFAMTHPLVFSTFCSTYVIIIIIIIIMSLFSEDYILSKIYLSNIWSSIT